MNSVDQYSRAYRSALNAVVAKFAKDHAPNSVLVVAKVRRR